MERSLLLENLPQVTFDDAAIYFSEEQWQNLEDFQKKIYKELIKEIYETMLALGYRIPKPEIVSRIERGEEPCMDSNKKPKLDGGQAEGSKDAEITIKVERESPEASAQFPPSEISSSQERSGAQCPRCGTCCNNQCGVGYQWHAQGVYTGPPMDNNHRKQFVTPSPTYFNGSPISPGYANRGEGMPHPTSPMAYGNVGMVPLSPHYPVYRNVGDPHTTFPFPERPPNPMFGNFEVNQPTQMGPPGSHMTASDHESRSRKEPYPHPQGQFQDRRNPMGPCPGCGTFCNNQCGANFQWEQRRLHHPVPGPMDTNRYASPPNPYFGGGVNPAAFPNARHPLRHGTPPANAQGNPAMIQLSPQYAGYRRSGDPNSPNVLHGKPEHSPGHTIHGGSPAATTLHGPNQGGKYGTIPANMGGNHRKSQSMSPLAALETMPMLATNNGQNTDQRGRPPNQMVSSSPNSINDQRGRPPSNQMVSSSPNSINDQRGRPPSNQMVSSSPNSYNDQRGRPPSNQMVSSSPNSYNDQRGRPPSNQMVSSSPNTVMEQWGRPPNQMVSSSPNTVMEQRGRPPNQMVNSSPNAINEQRSRPPNQMGNHHHHPTTITEERSRPTNQMGNQHHHPTTITEERSRPTNQMGNHHYHHPTTITEERSRPTNQMGNHYHHPTTITEERSRPTNQMANNNPNTAPEQRGRPPAQTVTSSDGSRGPLPSNVNKRQDVQCTTLGNRLKAVTPPTVHNAPPKPMDVTFNRNSSLASSHAPRNVQPSSTQEASRTVPGEHLGAKRPAPQPADSGVPSKRVSPTVIIVDCDEGKPSSPMTSANHQATTTSGPPTSRSESHSSGPIVVSDGQDPNQDGRRPSPPMTLNSIRTSGIFTPPIIKGRKEAPNDSNHIIIIDDKDPEVAAPQTLPAKETQSSSGTPPMKNPQAAGEPPPLAPKIQPQGLQQGTPMLVNKVQMQQPSPIIVTGGTSLGNQPLPVNGNQSIMLTFPMSVGSSGIMLATPVNVADNHISGVNSHRAPGTKNPRFLQPNNVTNGNVNPKLGQVTVRHMLSQANRLAVPLPHGQPKPITVNVNQPGGVGGGMLSINNTNLQKVNGGTLKAIAGNQPVGQPIPLFVDANSGLILTGSAVSSKDGMGNATVVTVNGGVVGNVGPMAMGGKLAFSPVNGLGNTTFITVDGAMGLGNNSSVTLAGNPTNIGNKTGLNLGNPTILTLNGGLGIGGAHPISGAHPIGGAHPVGAPIANIASINTNSTLQVAPPAPINAQQNIIIRKVGEPSAVPHNPPPSDDPPVVVVERLFNCSECGEKFNSLERLTAHQALHKRPPGQTDGNAGPATSKDNEGLPGGADDDAPTILYTTQGDDGSTVYVVTV